MNCKKLTLYVLITILFFIPFYVNAKESCTIVSGNGTDIGSEIACGTEHFYVIDSNDTSVRMLAKYNLLVGETINRITFSQERWDELVSKYSYDWYGSTYFYGSMLAEPEFDGEYGFSNNGMNAFDVDNRAIYTIKEWNMEYKKIVVSEERFNELQTQYGISFTGNDYSHDILNEPEFDGWFISYINPEYYTFGVFREIDKPVKQDSTAIGAHGSTPGSPDFPHVGIVKNQYDMGFYYDAQKTDDYRGGYNDFIIDKDQFDTNNYYLKYLNSYRNTLSDYEIEEYSLFTVGELDNIVYKLTNNHLPLEDWLTGWQSATGVFGNYVIMGSFKEYLPSGYEWLYSTTYWTRSGIGNEATSRYEIFIDTLGNVCNDDYCSSAVGAGVRPVITIPKIEVPSYTITPVTDENGTIEVATESAGGESISFVLKAKAGYKLKNLVLKTASGTEVAFDNVTQDDSGNIIVYTSNFVMPNENVTLTATWEEIIYDIEKDTNDNGKIEVVPESAGGNEVLFVLKAKSGFKLKSIAILNENNEVVDYAELTEELEEGIYVYRSKFVMPNNGVTIKAVWEEIEEEPVTPDEPEVVEYEIKNNITGDGKIEVASKAKKGDEVTFKLTSLNGSTLTKLVLKNSNGDEIEYTNISEDKDGNTVILVNKFTMVDSNITIDATFEVVQVPITGDNLVNYIMILIGSLIILTITKITYKKNNKKKILVVE